MHAASESPKPDDDRSRPDTWKVRSKKHLLLMLVEAGMESAMVLALLFVALLVTGSGDIVSRFFTRHGRALLLSLPVFVLLFMPAKSVLFNIEMLVWQSMGLLSKSADPPSSGG